MARLIDNLTTKEVITINIHNVEVSGEIYEIRDN